MRKIIKLVSLLSFWIFINFSAFSQSLPPPPPPQGGSGGAVGGSAPIGNGTLILILLATGFLIIKLKKYRMEEKQ